MNVSYRWLRAVAPGLEDPPEVVAERLAARGAPVEGMERLDRGLESVRVGRVESVRAHPDADRLVLCDVQAGDGVVQVVCGAPNVTEGGLYPFAPPGTRLPGGIDVGEAEIRGQTSRGMLCSERELGLGRDRSGLMTLSPGHHPGSFLVEALSLDDVRFDVEVTPNRGDLLSHLGVAREVAPGGEAGLRLPAVPGEHGVELRRETDLEEVVASGARIRIDAPDDCRRYLGAVLRDVEVGPSPPWLAARLRAAGARPINNVVDATNYVLLEMGQPLHAFDLSKLADETIVVRRAREGERLTTLDGEERELTPEMLCICDAREPVALAGVMGGADSEVSGETTDVLLECALFEPTRVRTARRALEMSTDASFRFERGVDPEGMIDALTRAVEIIVATSGGRAEPVVLDAHPRPWEGAEVTVRPGRVEQVLGVAFDAGELAGLLEPLGFGVEPDEGTVRVRIPGWRSYDVTREVDVIEEVARARGYDRFPSELGAYRAGDVPDHPLFGLEDELRDALVGRGYLEAQRPAFVPRDGGEVTLANPISEEYAALRTTLIPGLLEGVEHNFAHGLRDVRLFELGTCFFSGEGDRPREETRLGVVVTGRRHPPHWSREGEPVDLWDVKGLLSELGETGRIPGAEVVPGAADDPVLEPGAAFVLEDGEDDVVGRAGRVRSGLVDAPPWAGAVYALEVTLPADPEPAAVPTFRPLPSFPGVERDLALLVPDGLEVGAVRRAIRDAGGEHLTRVEIFDLYEGEGIPEGTRSVAFRLHYTSPERTLVDEEVDRATRNVVETLEEELDVEPRGG